MPIDTATALAAPPRSAAISWDHKDIQLYHLGIGAGIPATDPGELRYTLESRLHVLPSFATVAGGGMKATGGLGLPGIDVSRTRLLHGGQTIRAHRPIPVHGSAVQTSSVRAVYDKGQAAVVVLGAEIADDDGPLWTSETQIFVRGEGGFGGERGPSVRLPLPDRAPDRTVDRRTREDQALLYRLCGDWNPLHADPEFAKLAGFDRPNLHGLCTYGLVLKAVVDTALDGDVSRVGSYTARFAGVLFPGEPLRIRMWHTPAAPGSAGRVQLSVTAPERGDAPVLADAFVEHS
jgi:acyl dehydratase